MTESEWTTLPFPLSQIATERRLPVGEAPGILELLLEESAAVAGVLATAAAQDECEQADVTFAARHLAELLHATVALWRQWREIEDAQEGAHLMRTPGGKVGTS